MDWAWAANEHVVKADEAIGVNHFDIISDNIKSG